MNTIFLIPTRSTSIPSKGPMIEPWARASAKPKEIVVRLQPNLCSSTTRKVPRPWKTVRDMIVRSTALIPTSFQP